YLRPAFEKSLPRYQAGELVSPTGAEVLGAASDDGDERDAVSPGRGTSVDSAPRIDRTAKLYIGGKQKRPDGDYSYPVIGASGERAGEAPLGNRKDIRDAVEAAVKSAAWTAATAHNRAQVLYYV